MSLGIVVKGSEGLVLAADSRATIGMQFAQPVPNQPDPVMTSFAVNFDHATKLLTFQEPNRWIGAVTYGAAVIGQNASDLRTAQSFIPEFELSLPPTRISVQEFSQRLSDFYMARWQERMPQNWQGDNMIFVIAGFDENGPYGSVFLLTIPSMPNPVEQSPGNFGITGGGQGEILTRLLQGYDPRVIPIAQQTLALSNQQQAALAESLVQQLMWNIPYAVLPLQDCIDLAIFLIKTTTVAQALSMGVRGVGGAIDVAVITRREGLQIIQKKILTGERPV